MANYTRIDIKNIDIPYDYKIFNEHSPSNSKKLKKTTIWYKVNGSITEEDVKKINQLPGCFVLVLDNTKGQNSEIIKKLDSTKVRLSVLGGLDYCNKKKYNIDNYILRTINSPIELSKVIEFFEKIERGIKYTWTDEQKCMYIYKVLVEKMHYKYDNEREFENGKDVVRMLQGVLYGKLVCAGFALVFKEAMDRIGIPCLYQNVQHHHSWNIIHLNGKNYGVDLTWDCCSKGKNNECKFIYFGRDNNFYNNKHHDISNELEEIKCKLSTFEHNVLSNNLYIITKQKNIGKYSFESTYDCYGNKVNYYMIAINLYVIKTSKHLSVISTNNLVKELKTNSIDNILLKNSPNIKFKKYIRQDESEFLIIDRNKTKKGVKEFYYIDILNTNNSTNTKTLEFRRGVILSEMDLCNPTNEIIRRLIANNLLSHERLARKINYYNGYVGYIGTNYNMFYDSVFEKEELGIHVRK